MKKRILSMILTAAMASAVFAGCNTNQGGNASDGGSASAGSESTGGETVAGEAEYGIILKTQASDFWVKMKEGIEAEAEKQGVKVDIQAAQSEEDTEGQVKIFENMLGKNYKAIGVAPLSPVNVVKPIVDANAKGIYVMNIDEKVDMETLKASGGSVIGFATTDNVAVGRKGAEYIMELLPEGGKVAIIEGKAGNVSGENRKQGATEAFQSDSKFELLTPQPGDWDRQKALDVATSYIQANPDLKGIYCCNDTMALGAQQAVINAGKVGEIFVVGTDGDTEARDSVEQGQLAATVAQDPAEIGAQSLRAMIEAVEKGAPIDPDAEPVEYPIDSILVKKES